MITTLKKEISKYDNGIIFTKPTITTKELKSVLECMVQDEISCGKIVKNFENISSNVFGFKKALSAPSLNSAYHLALLGLGIQEGDEVIMTSLAPLGGLDAIGYLKATPVIIDAARGDFHPSMDQIMEKVNKNTKAIILSYPYGAFKNYDELKRRIKDLKRIKIIEDISEIIGFDFKKTSISDWTIISFHSDMLITMGNGAMLLTNADHLYSMAKDLQMHGGSRPYRIRYDYTITDYQAAMGLEQINHLETLSKRCRKIGHLYLEAIQQSRFKTYFKFKEMDIYSSFPVFSEKNTKDMIRHFKNFGIETRRIVNYSPLHQLMELSVANFRNTEGMYKRGILIPIYPHLNKQSIDRIILAIKKFY